MLDAFVAYARFCFDEFPEVDYWSTFNEIYPLPAGCHLPGHQRPCALFSAEYIKLTRDLKMAVDFIMAQF